jgi:DNA-binding transcriptional regulator YdaS (Cro superfamily)
MHLAEYLRRKQIPIKVFASLIGYTPQHVYRVVKGKMKCKKKCAMLISAATRGEVSVKDMMNDPKPEKLADPVNLFENEEMSGKIKMTYIDPKEMADSFVKGLEQFFEGGIPRVYKSKEEMLSEFPEKKASQLEEKCVTNEDVNESKT